MGVLAIPAWPLALLLVALMLLGVFHQVVRQAVTDGDARRTAAALRQEAVWRCNTLRERQQRSGCLAAVAGVQAFASVLRRVKIDDVHGLPRLRPVLFADRRRSAVPPLFRRS